MSQISSTIKEMISQQTLTLHTCLVCEVLQITKQNADGLATRVKVQPLTKIQTATGEIRSHTALDDVPVLEQAAEKISVGAICVVIFAERDISAAVAGVSQVPSTARHHALADGIIIGTIAK